MIGALTGLAGPALTLHILRTGGTFNGPVVQARDIRQSDRDASS